MDGNERQRERRRRGRADEGERLKDRRTDRGWEREFKWGTDREGKRKLKKKRRERASGGTYYTAVTPLQCGSEWERLSTHYSSDLGGQSEESSINQTDAQAEADDSRQQCSKQTLPPPPINTTTSNPSNPPHIYIYLPLHWFAFLVCLHIFSLSVHISRSFFPLLLSISLFSPIIHLPLSSSLYALNPLWIPCYKQWINPSPPCVNGLLNISPCLWICHQHLHWMWDWVSCLLATRRHVYIDLLVLLSALVHILWKNVLAGSQIHMFVSMHVCMCVMNVGRYVKNDMQRHLFSNVKHSCKWHHYRTTLHSILCSGSVSMKYTTGPDEYHCKCEKVV